MAVLKNPKWEKFAQGVATGLSGTEAYIRAGYGKAGAAVSANRLLRNANIRQRVDELTERVAEKVLEVSIADRKNRLAALNERWRLMEQIRRERATEMTKKDGKPVVAGASTGMLARTFKAIGTGQNQRIVPEFAFDAALFREMRACEEYAEEVTQWLERTKDGTAVETGNFLWQLAQQMVDGPIKKSPDATPDEAE